MKGLPAWESVGFRPNLSVLKRVRQVADSRVVAGVHYTSDTEAGLPWATCSSHRSKHSLGFRRTWMLAMMANITTLMTSPLFEFVYRSKTKAATNEDSAAANA